MAKRLTNKQKEEIIQSFIKGITVDYLSKNYQCTKATIIRNLKKELGESEYESWINKSKFTKNNNSAINEDGKDELSVNKLNININNSSTHLDKSQVGNKNNDEAELTVYGITPLDYEIENAPRKDFSCIYQQWFS